MTDEVINPEVVDVPVEPVAEVAPSVTPDPVPVVDVPVVAADVVQPVDLVVPEQIAVVAPVVVNTGVEAHVLAWAQEIMDNAPSRQNMDFAQHMQNNLAALILRLSA